MSAKQPDAKTRLVQAAIQKLESLELAGVTQLPRATGRARAAAALSAGDAMAARVYPPAAIPSQPSTVPSPLEALRGEVAACTRCAELASTRTQTVFGVGNPQARLCFLGEAPGADEDLQGEPFVGRAGQLLTKIIEACKLSRTDVYILNVLKCRPPGNRTPAPEEADNCRGFLDRQLEIIRPEFICCLGAVAAQSLLRTTVTISRLRGQWFEYRGSTVICTFHPSYLLRNPSAKKDVWEDMKRLMERMGMPVG